MVLATASEVVFMQTVIIKKINILSLLKTIFLPIIASSMVLGIFMGYFINPVSENLLSKILSNIGTIFCIGFSFGVSLIFATITYNFFSNITGGIKVEVEKIEN